MYVIINKRYVEINHVQPVKKVGAAFPKEGTTPIAITAKGRIHMIFRKQENFAGSTLAFLMANRMEMHSFTKMVIG